MRQAHIFVSGFVQGVGYRAYTRSKARKLSLTGWVRNLTDERVEAVIQGDEAKIRLLLKICRRGPFFAKVEEIVVEWEEVTEAFPEFRKLPTV